MKLSDKDRWNEWKAIATAEDTSQVRQARGLRRKSKAIKTLVCEELDRKRSLNIMRREVQGDTFRNLARQPDLDLLWRSALFDLHPDVFKFAPNALLQTLPTGDNRKRWNMRVSSICSRCKTDKTTYIQTLGHILGACCKEEQSKFRAIWRHNQILRELIRNLQGLLPEEYEIHADLNEVKDDYEVLLRTLIGTTVFRPDVLVYSKIYKEVCVLELTSPHVRNMAGWHEFKTRKYEAFCQRVRDRGTQVSFYAFEVDQLGAIGKSTATMLNDMGLPKKEIRKVCNKLSRMALDCSYQMFKYRDTDEWPWNID